jgi:hypothetical protein
MIRWLKYYPLKLRSPDRERENYAGPEFIGARPVSVEFEANRIELRAPRNRTVNKNAVSIYIAKSSDQDAGFTYLQNVATDNWRYADLLARRWSYVYPWFGGRASELYFNIGVYKRKPGKEFKNTDFIHPKGFENALCNLLDNEYGDKQNNHGPRYRGPLDWHRRDDLAIQAVEFWIKGSSDDCYLVFPITDRHLLSIRFGFMSHDQQMQEQADPLVRQILDSVKVTLSPDTQAKWDRIKAENPGVSISETFAPLKWPVKPEDIA